MFTSRCETMSVQYISSSKEQNILKIKQEQKEFIDEFKQLPIELRVKRFELLKPFYQQLVKSNNLLP